MPERFRRDSHLHGDRYVAAPCWTDQRGVATFLSPQPKPRKSNHEEAKRNLQDDLRGTYARNWTISIDQNGRRIVHTSGINEDAPSEKMLARQGLAPKVKNVWSKSDKGGDCDE